MGNGLSKEDQNYTHLRVNTCDGLIKKMIQFLEICDKIKEEYRCVSLPLEDGAAKSRRTVEQPATDAGVTAAAHGGFETHPS